SDVCSSDLGLPDIFVIAAVHAEIMGFILRMRKLFTAYNAAIEGAIPRTPGCLTPEWVCSWSGGRTRVQFPFRELNWPRKTGEVERPFRPPTRPKNLLEIGRASW